MSAFDITSNELIRPFRIPRKSNASSANAAKPDLHRPIKEEETRSPLIHERREKPQESGWNRRIVPQAETQKRDTQRYTPTQSPNKRKAPSTNEHDHRRKRSRGRDAAGADRPPSPMQNILSSMQMPHQFKEVKMEELSGSASPHSGFRAEMFPRECRPSMLTKDRVEKIGMTTGIHSFARKGLMEAILEQKMKNGRVDPHKGPPKVRPFVEMPADGGAEEEFLDYDGDQPGPSRRRGPKTPPGEGPLHLDRVSRQKGPATPSESPPSSGSKSPSLRGRSSQDGSEMETGKCSSRAYYEKTSSSKGRQARRTPKKEERPNRNVGEEGNSAVLDQIAQMANVDVQQLFQNVSPEILQTLQTLDPKLLVATVSTVLNTIATSLKKDTSDSAEVSSSTQVDKRRSKTPTKISTIADTMDQVVTSTGVCDESVEMDIDSEASETGKHSTPCKKEPSGTHGTHVSGTHGTPVQHHPPVIPTPHMMSQPPPMLHTMLHTAPPGPVPAMLTAPPPSIPPPNRNPPHVHVLPQPPPIHTLPQLPPMNMNPMQIQPKLNLDSLNQPKVLPRPPPLPQPPVKKPLIEAPPDSNMISSILYPPPAPYPSQTHPPPAQYPPPSEQYPPKAHPPPAPPQLRYSGPLVIPPINPKLLAPSAPPASKGPPHTVQPPRTPVPVTRTPPPINPKLLAPRPLTPPASSKPQAQVLPSQPINLQPVQAMMPNPQPLTGLPGLGPGPNPNQLNIIQTLISALAIPKNASLLPNLPNLAGVNLLGGLSLPNLASRNEPITSNSRPAPDFGNLDNFGKSDFGSNQVDPASVQSLLSSRILGNRPAEKDLRPSDQDWPEENQGWESPERYNDTSYEDRREDRYTPYDRTELRPLSPPRGPSGPPGPPQFHHPRASPLSPGDRFDGPPGPRDYRSDGPPPQRFDGPPPGPQMEDPPPFRFEGPPGPQSRGRFDGPPPMDRPPPSSDFFDGPGQDRRRFDDRPPPMGRFDGPPGPYGTDRGPPLNQDPLFDRYGDPLPCPSRPPPSFGQPPPRNEDWRPKPDLRDDLRRPPSPRRWEIGPPPAQGPPFGQGPPTGPHPGPPPFGQRPFLDRPPFNPSVMPPMGPSGPRMGPSGPMFGFDQGPPPQGYRGPPPQNQGPWSGPPPRY